MNKKKVFSTSFFILLTISVLYLSLIVIGIVHYSGGTRFNTNTWEYSLHENYLSDLGMTIPFNGNNNLVPNICFLLSLSLAGLGTIWNLIILKSYLCKNHNLRGLCTTALIFGMISSLLLISIGFFPTDTSKSIHRIATVAFGICLVPTHLLFGIAILKENSYSKFYGAWFIGSAILISLYILLNLVLGFDGPYKEEVIKIILQKVVLFFVVFGTTIIESYGTRKQILKPPHQHLRLNSKLHPISDEK